jgi:DNA helicase-2/ATP-dependent DNA helicase PcrA
VPSRFIDELPAAHVERTSDPGLYAGARAGGFSEAAAEPDPGAGMPWARRRFAARAALVEQVPVHAVRARKSQGGFKTGDEVFHQKFGYGRVRLVDGDKLEIAFETGVKKVLDSFVEPV